MAKKSFTQKHKDTLSSVTYPEWGPEVFAAIDEAWAAREAGEKVTMSGLIKALREEFGLVMGTSTIRTRILEHLGRESWYDWT